MTETGPEPTFAIVPFVISEYLHHDPVPQVEEDLVAIVELLEEFGGAVLPWDSDPAARTGAAVIDRFSAWAAHPTPRSSIILWLGHGEAVANDAWLATHETGSPMRYRGFRPESLRDALVNEWHQRGNDEHGWTVVVVEACGSGTFAQVMARAMPADDPPKRLAILPVGGEGAAYAGQFRRALHDAVRSYTVNDKVVQVDDLFRRIILNLHSRNEIMLGMYGLPPIRRHDVPTTATLPLDTYAMLKAVLGDLPVTHTQGGQLKELTMFFVGREDDLLAVVRWLREASHGLFIVTGPAGSGKSALLGTILAHTIAELREVLERNQRRAAMPQGMVLDDGVFDAVVHLTGLTTDDVVSRIARAAGLDELEAPVPAGQPGAERLIAGLSKLGRRFTVLADALDEAQEAYAIAASVLRQMAALPNVRVVVGTRISPHDDPDNPLPEHPLLDALGTGEHTVARRLQHEPVAISEYVRLRLEADYVRHDAPPVYIRTVADKVSVTRRPFLFAHLVVNELLAAPELLRRGRDAERRLDQLLEQTHRGLLERAAMRLAAASPFAGALLEALGAARGRGLPRTAGIWALTAAALAEPGLTRDPAIPPRVEADRQIDGLLGSAAPYIMLDAQDGRSVYRLAHRTFRDYYLERPSTLAGGEPGRNRHGLVAAALIAAAQQDPSVAADPYVTRHLVEHVARAGGWHALAEAPTVLDRLDPNAVTAQVLRRAFGVADLPVEITAVAAARHNLAKVGSGDRASIRILCSARSAEWTAPLHGALSEYWRWSWAEVRRDPLSIVLTGHRGVVTASAAVPIPDGRVLLATGGSDRSVRLWDPTSGQPTGPPIRAHKGVVVALAAAVEPGRAVLASCGTDGAVRLWNPATGDHLGDLPRPPGAAFSALALVADGTMFATGDRTGSVRLWDTRGQQVGAAIATTGGKVTALCPVPGGARLAAGAADGRVRLVNPARPGWSAGYEPQLVGGVRALCPVRHADGRVTLTATGNESTVLQWTVGGDGTVSSLAGHVDSVNAAVPVVLPDGRQIVATGGNDRTIRLWSGGSELSAPLTGHDMPIRTLTALPLPDSRSVLASGGDDGTVRLWAPTVDVPAGTGRARYIGAVTALAVTGTGTLVMGTDGKRVRLRDATTDNGPPIAEITVTFQITALAAFVGPDDAPLVAIGGDEADVWIWSPLAGRSVVRPLRGHSDRVTALAAVTLPTGRRLLASGSEDMTVRLWDVVTGKEDTAAMTRHTGAITAVAAAVTPAGHPIIASAGHDEHVRLWLPGQRRPAATVPAIARARRPIALIRLADGTPRLITGGADAAVRAWDPQTGALIGAPMTGHDDAVTAVTAIYRDEQETMLVTAGADATVRLWDARSHAMLDTMRLDLPARALTSIGTRLLIGYDYGVVAIDLAERTAAG